MNSFSRKLKLKKNIDPKNMLNGIRASHFEEEYKDLKSSLQTMKNIPTEGLNNAAKAEIQRNIENVRDAIVQKRIELENAVQRTPSEAKNASVVKKYLGKIGDAFVSLGKGLLTPGSAKSNGSKKSLLNRVTRKLGSSNNRRAAVRLELMEKAAAALDGLTGLNAIQQTVRNIHDELKKCCGEEGHGLGIRRPRSNSVSSNGSNGSNGNSNSGSSNNGNNRGLGRVPPPTPVGGEEEEASRKPEQAKRNLAKTEANEARAAANEANAQNRAASAAAGLFGNLNEGLGNIPEGKGNSIKGIQERAKQRIANEENPLRSVGNIFNTANNNPGAAGLFGNSNEGPKNVPFPNNMSRSANASLSKPLTTANPMTSRNVNLEAFKARKAAESKGPAAAPKAPFEFKTPQGRAAAQRMAAVEQEMKRTAAEQKKTGTSLTRNQLTPEEEQRLKNMMNLNDKISEANALTMIGQNRARSQKGGKKKSRKLSKKSKKSSRKNRK
jgi:hypothetical protein